MRSPDIGDSLAQLAGDNDADQQCDVLGAPVSTLDGRVAQLVVNRINSKARVAARKEYVPPRERRALDKARAKAKKPAPLRMPDPPRAERRETFRKLYPNDFKDTWKLYVATK